MYNYRLILASKNGHEKSVKQLLQQPHIDVIIQDENGDNCLALISSYKQTSIRLESI